LGAGWELSQQQAFDGTAAGNAASEKSRWKHARVVEDEQIAGIQVVDESGERRVLDPVRIAVQHKQP
jgi:hypothetical protein